jgi:hypothetical protein
MLIILGFNPAKNFQLGWYDKQTASYNPADILDKSKKKLFVMNGVNEYNKEDGGNELISLRLENKPGGRDDFYIGKETLFLNLILFI